MALLATFFLFIWFFALATTLLGTWVIWKNKRRPYTNSETPPPISIVKPLCGMEPGLEQNIRSFLALEYPDYELILTVASDEDPCLAVIAPLLNEFGSDRLRLNVGEVQAGINPKINNLLPACDLARHDLVLISDSNVRVWPEYLAEVAAAMKDGVGVVTALVAGVGARGVGGHLEAAYLNTFVARWTALGATLKQPCVIGKTMLFRKSVMRRMGGLQALAQYINEDYMAGVYMHTLKLRTALIASPVPQFIGRCSFSHFWMRHVRWGRLRRVQFGPAFFLEPILFYAVGSGLVGVCGVSALSPGYAVPFFVSHLCVWAFADLFLMREMMGTLCAQSVLAWVGRELLALPHWVHMAARKSLSWRGHSLPLSVVGRAAPVGKEPLELT